MQRRQRTTALAALAVATQEIGAAPQRVLPTEPLCRRFESTHHDSARLGAQALASLAAATGDDRSALAGAHPSPKTVGLLATAIVGLESSFHSGQPSWFAVAIRKLGAAWERPLKRYLNLDCRLGETRRANPELYSLGFGTSRTGPGT